jgi:hypothetical protein
VIDSIHLANLDDKLEPTQHFTILIVVVLTDVWLISQSPKNDTFKLYNRNI